MGHVNHAVYLTYLEVARFAFWQQLTRASQGPAASIIIARAACNYRAPAFPGDEIEIRMNVGEIGRSSFTLVYEIVNVATGQLLADADTVLVAYDYAAGKSTLIPAETRAVLERVRIGS